MEEFLLSPNLYELLKTINLSEMDNDILFDDNNSSIKTSNADLLLTIITENITVFGMDENQNMPTEYGRELYRLYDEIYYQ